MNITLEEYLDQEWKIFLCGFNSMSEEEQEELYADWEPFAISAYNNMKKYEQNQMFLENAADRMNAAETCIAALTSAFGEVM